MVKPKFNKGDELLHIGDIEDWLNMITVCVESLPNTNYMYGLRYSFVNSWGERKIMFNYFKKDFVEENFIVKTEAAKVLYGKSKV